MLEGILIIMKMMKNKEDTNKNKEINIKDAKNTNINNLEDKNIDKNNENIINADKKKK